ncbi:MAG: PD40 domain-containing protein [Anaerolineae bacterium]|nr:PD40 domain-containing protein [Anaerolineae bacterium]
MNMRQTGPPLLMLAALLMLVACASTAVSSPASNTRTPPPTLAPTSTLTDTPVPTATVTQISTPTATPRPTRTPTALPTATQTPTVLPTATQTATPFPKVELPIGALAFVSYDRQLLVRDPAGTICAITEDGIASSPAWSPDGTRLAFSYQAGDKAAAELRIYDLQSGHQTTAWRDPGDLAPMVLPIREMAWSPTGRYLAFSRGCCPLGPVSIWDLEAAALAGYRGAYRMFWGPDEDVLTLSIPQPVGEFIPIGSGDSTSIALVRPYEISPTVVLTGTTKTLYDPRAWLSSDELAYMRLDMGDEEKETEHTWWRAQIVDGEAVDHRQLDAPPLAHDNDPLQEHLSPWLPAVMVGDYDWSADGAWVVFSANQGGEDPWRIYVFHWTEGQLVGPFAEANELALAPVRTTWRCPE